MQLAPLFINRQVLMPPLQIQAPIQVQLVVMM